MKHQHLVIVIYIINRFPSRVPSISSYDHSPATGNYIDIDIEDDSSSHWYTTFIVVVVLLQQPAATYYIVASAEELKYITMQFTWEANTYYCVRCKSFIQDNIHNVVIDPDMRRLIALHAIAFITPVPAASSHV